MKRRHVKQVRKQERLLVDAFGQAARAVIGSANASCRHVAVHPYGLGLKRAVTIIGLAKSKTRHRGVATSAHTHVAEAEGRVDDHAPLVQRRVVGNSSRSVFATTSTPE